MKGNLGAQNAIKIFVTDEDIRDGVFTGPGSTMLCPVALAIKRALPDAKQINVLVTVAQVDGVVYKLPRFIQRRIFTVDPYNWPFSEREFELEVEA